MTPLATAAFDFDNADCADVTWRLARRSPAVRSRLRTGIALTAAAAGVGLPVLLYATRQSPSPVALLVAGVVAAVASGALSAFTVPARYRRAVRAHLLRRYGPGPHRCVVELHDAHVLLRQFGDERLLPWADLVSLREDGADFEMRTPRHIVVVRGHQFTDAAAREHFVATARRLATASR